MTVTSLAPAARVLQRNLWVYRRTWRGSILGSFLTPLLYLSAMGLALGQLVTAGTAAFEGYPFVQFLGPGILAATCMQSAVFESTFPVLGKIAWRRNYEAMLATPLDVRHLLAGELLWVGFRVLTISSVFLVVLTLFGIPRWPFAILAIPAAILMGFAFSSVIIAFAATQRNGEGFSWVFRFVINPLFLFSGTFFPLTQLPEPVQWVAALTPLYHGVALIRGTILNEPAFLGLWPLHVAYLLGMLAIGWYLAHKLLKRRLLS
ncbi:MAG TPA: ABC transporter permease [Candidatus Limnocylindria bacterium]|jgi:lipooligosaccharide transport system permease protein|nr:ABC transporter permease [Candidatus Limnocylindria bacterium]